MTTRVAVPVLSYGCNMSSEVRRILPSPHLEGVLRPSRVRRNLFGPVDHKATDKLVHDELAKIAMADSQRWNFDFLNETPLQGRYEWQPVTEVPPAYALPLLTASTFVTKVTPPPSPKESPAAAEVPPPVQQPKDSKPASEAFPDEASSSSKEEEEEDVDVRRPHQCPDVPPAKSQSVSKQSFITDFMKIQKSTRPACSASSSSSSKKKRSASVELDEGLPPPVAKRQRTAS